MCLCLRVCVCFTELSKSYAGGMMEEDAMSTRYVFVFACVCVLHGAQQVVREGDDRGFHEYCVCSWVQLHSQNTRARTPFTRVQTELHTHIHMNTHAHERCRSNAGTDTCFSVTSANPMQEPSGFTGMDRALSSGVCVCMRTTTPS